MKREKVRYDFLDKSLQKAYTGAKSLQKAYTDGG